MPDGVIFSARPWLLQYQRICGVVSSIHGNSLKKGVAVLKLLQINEGGGEFGLGAGVVHPV
jgi:hypothetical protein